MKVPLCLIETNTSFKVVRNGEMQEVPFPFKPYILGKKNVCPNGAEQWIDLWTKEQLQLGREVFDDLKSAKDYYQAAGRKECIFMAPKEQTYLEHKDWILQFPQTMPLKVMILDIECDSEGNNIFPKASKNPITCIGVKVLGPNGIRKCIMNFDKEKWSDKAILEEFRRIYQLVNPDIITGYNVEEFDIPYIIERLKQNKMSATFLTRDNSMPFEKRERDGKAVMVFHLAGRIIWDLFKDVKKDQSLLGIKDRKLKTIGRHYGVPMIEEDRSNLRALINTPRLEAYNLSDVDGTGVLFDIYSPRQIVLAEIMQLPLEEIVNGFNSTVARIMCGRELLQQRFIPLETNQDRYPMTQGEDGKKFEAAYVEIMQHGLFDPVWKLDVSGMYPSIMRTFNLGPDTVKFINWYPYNPEGFSITCDGKTCYIMIPDANFQQNVMVSVDMTRDSFIRKQMAYFFDKRMQLKQEMKKYPEKSAEWNAINSQSWAIKVGQQNVVFGYMGLKYGRWADMPIGMAVCAIGRWIIKAAMEQYKGAGIEVDTDGIYLNAEPNVEEADRMVEVMVAKAIRQKCHIAFEKEGPWKGYFHKAKNYVLKTYGRKREEDNGKLTFHGVSMKTSRTCRAFDIAVKRIAEVVLSGANEDAIRDVVMNVRDLKQYKMEDFVQHVTINQTEYKSKTDFKLALMVEVEQTTGKKATKGESIEYLKCKDGYHIANRVKSLDELDQDYYLGQILKAQELFDRQDIHKTPEQLAQEAAFAKEKALKGAITEEKGRLKRYIEGVTFEGIEAYANMTIEQAKERIRWLEKVQEAYRSKWPCAACQGQEYEIYELLGVRCLKCSWVGLPIKPVKPRKKKVKEEANA